MAPDPRKDRFRIVLISVIVALCANAQSDPSIMLAEADRYADQGNWQRARELYSTAEKVFQQNGDHRNELYARFGRQHGDAEASSYKAVREKVVIDLDDPAVETDSQLKIRGLALLGSIDLNLDTAAAHDDWSKVLALAKVAGDR